MICYRDRTYCNFRDCAAFGPCPRSFTDDVEVEAIESGLPVSLFSQKPDCFVLSEEARKDVEFELRERKRLDMLDVMDEMLGDVDD